MNQKFLYVLIIAIALVGLTLFAAYGRNQQEMLSTEKRSELSAVSPSLPQSQTGSSGSTSLVEPTPTPNVTADWKVYRNGKYGYAIKYPTDWDFEEYRQSQIPGTSSLISEVGFGKPPAPKGTEGGSPVVIDVLSDSLQKAIGEFGSYNRKEFSREKILINKNFQAIKVKGRLYGLVGGPAEAYEGLTTTSVFIERNNRVYELRFQEESKTDMKNAEIFDEMVSTFHFTD